MLLTHFAQAAHLAARVRVGKEEGETPQGSDHRQLVDTSAGTVNGAGQEKDRLHRQVPGGDLLR